MGHGADSSGNDPESLTNIFPQPDFELREVHASRL